MKILGTVHNVVAYTGLFLAIQSGDWQLRMASMKSMAAVFTAFDHSTYQKPISQHLVDLQTMPVPTMFSARGIWSEYIWKAMALCSH